MKEKERISNLEELMAEVLMRLERLRSRKFNIAASTEINDSPIDVQMLELAKYQIDLDKKQDLLRQSMLILNELSRKSSLTFETFAATMSTKEGLNNLFEAMMNRFDSMQAQIDEKQ